MAEPRGIDPPDDLEALAAAVLAGEDVDWRSTASAVPGEQQGVVRQLEALSTIARFYAGLQHVDAPAAGPILADGTMWGPLRIEGLIGAGGYGEVYRAHDTRLGRDVALKLLRDTPGDAASTSIAEARRLARVHHPHVVTIHGAEAIDGRLGLWMELVPGETLAALLARRGPLPARDVTAIGHALAQALQAVHGAGLVHGDVKAQNVMRTSTGRVVLMDFGAGTDAMTPRYAAPEIRQGARPTQAADIYSLGVLLHLLATGRFPDGRPAAGTAPHAPAALPTRLARVLADALADDASARPSADVLAERLTAAPANTRTLAAWAVGLAAIVSTALLLTSRAIVPEPGGVALTGVQRVPAPSHLLLGRPARHVPQLSFAEPGGHVALLDLTSMRTRRVVGAADGAGTEFTIPSPDASRIAYQWRLPDDRYELRIADTAGGSARVLLPADAVRYPQPIDWSADGRQLLVLGRTADGARELTLLPVDGGPPTPIRRFPASAPFAASLSPDGRFVAFDDLRPGSAARDVWVTEVGTGQEWPLAAHAASDAFPAWTPKGDAVLFVSTRAGSTDAWLQPVHDGRSLGDPRAVARHLGRMSPLGFGADGAYYYLAQSSLIDAMTAPIDWRTGRVGAPRRVSTRFEGASAQPAWSPDGRHLAYIALQGPIRGDRGGHVVVVRDTATGDERIVGESLGFVLPPLSWSSDGTQVLIRGVDGTNRASLHHVDVTSGRITSPLGSHPSPMGRGRWVGAGRELFALGPGGIVAVDGRTGSERLVLGHADSGLQQVLRFAVTADGREIAYSGALPGSDRTSLRVLDASGAIVELVRSAPGERLVVQCWSPDAPQVLFTRWTAGPTATPHALWMARRDGREVRSLDFAIAGWTQANGVTVHPDGTAIAYTAGDVSWELSRLVNFLTPPTGSPRF